MVTRAPDAHGGLVDTFAPVIHHVALETAPADGPAAERFWRLLGFRPVKPPPTLSDRAAWLQSGQTQIHLLWTEGPVAPPKGHAAVVLDDYDHTLARLRDAGYEVESRKEHWAAPRAFVRAPGGHRVEVMAAPPDGQHA